MKTTCCGGFSRNHSSERVPKPHPATDSGEYQTGLDRTRPPPVPSRPASAKS